MFKKIGNSVSLFMLVLLACIIWTCPASAQQASTCTTVPPIDHNGNFLSNFANSCYQVALGAGGFGNSYAGDTNAQYDIIYYHLNPGFELIFIGQHPNARYWGISTYDMHEANIGTVSDANMQPLTSAFINPFQPGAHWTAGQKWAATVTFGGTEPGDITPGCAIGSFNMHGNWMDATQIHSGLSWNGDPAAVSLPPHVTGPNSAGAILVRRYYTLGSESRPAVIVRDLATGCAITANDALNTYRVLTTDRTTYVGKWRDKVQWQAHYTYSGQIEPRWCYGVDTTQQPVWIRGPEWLPGANFDTAYVAAQLPAGLIGPPPVYRFIRVRLRVPKYPSIPCTTGNCTLTGNEEMRYMSVSFQAAGTTVASVKDSDYVIDQNGYATLIAGIGAPQPSWVTAANGYTWIDLTTNPAYTSLAAVNIRDIRANPTFICQGQNIPFRQQNWTPYGGLMGDYAPVVDFPLAKDLPRTAVPLIGPAGSCDNFPPLNTLQNCNVFYPGGPL